METRETKMKRAAALSAAWKSRPDYIDDLVQQNKRLHNSWRAIRFTEKGKRAGCCEEWKNYRTFFADTARYYFDGSVLRRKDIHKPWGPDNFIFVTTEQASAALEKVFIEYDGKNLSLRQWSVELGLPYNGIKLRYYRYKNEKDPEMVLFGKRKKRRDKAAKDIRDPKVNIRAKASKMLSAYRHKDRMMGYPPSDMTIEWFIENILLAPCHYCGDTKRVGCDRIDNNKGHSKDNVVPCCIECNTARNNYFTYEEMRRLGKTIAEIKKDRIQ